MEEITWRTCKLKILKESVKEYIPYIVVKDFLNPIHKQIL